MLESQEEHLREEALVWNGSLDQEGQIQRQERIT